MSCRSVANARGLRGLRGRAVRAVETAAAFQLLRRCISVAPPLLSVAPPVLPLALGILPLIPSHEGRDEILDPYV